MEAQIFWGVSYGLSGMASGVDLWFCEACRDLSIYYTACIPFKEQRDEVEPDEVELRDELIEAANCVVECRNSAMVEMANVGLVVWDGNKGGTHNVIQQLIENKKKFIWINPVSKSVNICE